MTDLGRNEPCHCGSGRKYKRCCLSQDEDRAVAAHAAAAAAKTDATEEDTATAPQAQVTAAAPPHQRHVRSGGAKFWESAERGGRMAGRSRGSGHR